MRELEGEREKNPTIDQQHQAQCHLSKRDSKILLCGLIILDCRTQAYFTYLLHKLFHFILTVLQWGALQGHFKTQIQLKFASDKREKMERWDIVHCCDLQRIVHLAGSSHKRKTLIMTRNVNSYFVGKHALVNSSMITWRKSLVWEKKISQESELTSMRTEYGASYSLTWFSFSGLPPRGWRRALLDFRRDLRLISTQAICGHEKGCKTGISDPSTPLKLTLG